MCKFLPGLTDCGENGQISCPLAIARKGMFCSAGEALFFGVEPDGGTDKTVGCQDRVAGVLSSKPN